DQHPRATGSRSRRRARARTRARSRARSTSPGSGGARPSSCPRELLELVLVDLYDRIREELLTHRANGPVRRVLIHRVERDDELLARANVRDVDAERPERAGHRLALRVADLLLWTHVQPGDV